jgi:predicted DNA-binding transcriptional regulator AlpA
MGHGKSQYVAEGATHIERFTFMTESNIEAIRAQLPKMITTEHLSKQTGIPMPTLHNWRYLRKGPRSFKLGRSVRYLESDVLAWIEEQQLSDPNWAVDTP